MFQLTKEEFESLRFQIETLEKSDKSLRLQTETLKKGRGQHTKYFPYAFTEQGVAMLSSILNSDKAINMNPDSYRDYHESFCRNNKGFAYAYRFETAVQTDTGTP
jgi:ORF6N domain